jgi:hypothetical protein
MGDRAEYVKIAGKGPNALDFHIAFYSGTSPHRTRTPTFTSFPRTRASIH